jgi:predicted HicB family RNase H-like nuclease
MKQKNREEAKAMKQTLFRLDTETHKRLRIAALEEGKSMNEALNEAVEMWLKEYRRNGAKK